MCDSKLTHSRDTAANQLAKVLASYSKPHSVGVLCTFCDYLSCVAWALSVVFGGECLADISRIRHVVKDFGKKHPANLQCADEEIWDPGVIISYWADRSDDSALSTVEVGGTGPGACLP